MASGAGAGAPALFGSLVLPVLSGITVTAFSPATGSVLSVIPSSSSARTPPRVLRGTAAGRLGRSALWAVTRRPCEVMMPYVERVVEGIAARMVSLAARGGWTVRDLHMSSALGDVRAIRPSALNIIAQGLSSSSSVPAERAEAGAAESADEAETAAVMLSVPAGLSSIREAASGTPTKSPDPSISSRTVRLGVSHWAAASSIDRMTTISRASSDDRISFRRAISRWRSSRSASSSIRLIFVSLRSRRSRIYCAWMPSRSKTAISRVFAASALSEVRITSITSSISISARSSPSTRCRRSSAFLLRYLLLRVITLRRCPIHTDSISLSPIVCGRPSTRATLLIVNESSRGVYLNS